VRLAPPPLEIGDCDGFDGTDVFGYEEFGANLVESLEGPSVLALDGGWGSGKTVFAKQWAGLLRKRGSAVIYFNAFAADAGDDPLFDIASELFAASPDGKERTDLAKAGGVLARHFLPVVAGVGLQFVTGGLIGAETINAGAAGAAEAKKAANDRAGQVSDAFRQRIGDVQARADALLAFRQKLIALAESMKAEALAHAEEVVDSVRPRPVVVIVDELDRCRPSYALHLLENIKHVFDIENVCFVMVTNLRQLTQVVASQYGVTEADTYLEKFVHSTFVLPEKKRYAKNTQYIKHLFWKRMGFEGNSKLRWPIELAVSHAGTSLRGIERVIPNVAWCLACGIFKERDQFGEGLSQDFEEVLVPSVVCVLRALNADMFARMRVHRLSSDEVREFLRVGQWEVGAPGKREEIQNILAREFQPKAAVEGDRDAMREWRSGSLRSLVERVCEVLDVLGDPVTRRRH
jgi:hypothetical protein